MWLNSVPFSGLKIFKKFLHVDVFTPEDGTDALS
jgi:hypothetical protein